MNADDPNWVEEASLKSLRFQNPSDLARRPDLEDIRHRIELALARCGARHDALGEALEALGAGRADKAVAYGGLTFAALGGLGLLAGGPLTWLVAAAAAGTIGGSGLALLGGARMWRHADQVERLTQQQTWLGSEFGRLKRALERVVEAIELKKLP